MSSATHPLSGDAAVFTVDGELTIYTVQALRQPLLDQLAAAPALVLDLQDVAEFDGAGLQLLVATQREAQACGKPLAVRAPSAAVMETLRQVGLAHALPLETPCGAAA